MDCQDGDCLEGMCLCPDGSQGSNCMSGKLRFDSVKVIGITIKKFPLKNNGTDWDLLVNTRPDIRLGINLDREVAYNSPIWEEAKGQKYLESNFKIGLDTVDVAVYFTDMDERGKTETMCALYFNSLDFHQNNYPESYVLRDLKGRAELEFFLEYE